MSTHTPAPWSTCYAADGSGDIGIVADGGCIAECFHEIRARGEGAREEQAANALLIAAAPDLLDIARRVEALLNAQRWLPEGNGVESVLLRDARAAIARATGAQQ